MSKFVIKKTADGMMFFWFLENKTGQVVVRSAHEFDTIASARKNIVEVKKYVSKFTKVEVKERERSLAEDFEFAKRHGE